MLLPDELQAGGVGEEAQATVGDQPLVDRAQLSCERRPHRRAEGDRLAVHGAAGRDDQVGDGDQALRVDGVLREDQRRKAQRRDRRVLLGGAGQHDGVHAVVGAEPPEHVGEEGIPVPVVQGHLGRRADDGDDAVTVNAERLGYRGVRLEARQVVLLLQPRVAAGLGRNGAEPVEPVLRDRGRDDDAGRRA